MKIPAYLICQQFYANITTNSNNNNNNHNAKDIVQDMTTQDSYNYKAANHYI